MSADSLVPRLHAPLLTSFQTAFTGRGEKFGLEMRLVDSSIAWLYAVLCMSVLSQHCSQALCPPSHHWKVRLHGTLWWGDILSSCPGRGHLVLGPCVQEDIWSWGTRGPPTVLPHSKHCSMELLKAVLIHTVLMYV